jgi:hypothetical protein
MYFLPLSAEQIAAMKYNETPMQNASLRALMNGDEMAVGKNPVPVIYVFVAAGIEATKA